MDKKKLGLLIVLGALVLICAVALIFLRGRRGTGTGGKIELVYWGLWEPESVMSEVIADYNKDHPNVTIKYAQQRFTQYEDTIYTRLADPNTTPDIVRINNTWTYKFQRLLSPLPAEVMTSSEYVKAFYPSATQDFTGADGQIYAIPLETDSLGLFYNKDLFRKQNLSTPPADWDTFIEYAKKLTKTSTTGKITQAGAGIGCSNNVAHAADILSALMLQNSVQMTNSTGTEVAFNTDKGAAALKYYTDFVKEHKVWSCGLRNDLDMFVEGKLAMFFGPSWRTFDIINGNSEINFGTAKLPQLPASDSPIYYGMYWGEAVSAQSRNQLEAWKFVKYLSEPEQQKKLYASEAQLRAFGEPYSRPSIATDLAKDPYVPAFIDMAPDLASWKLGDQKTSEDALKKAITSVNDAKYDSNSALEQAVTTINKKLKDIYGS